MFARQDQVFDDTAADPVRRRAAIADLSKRRTVLVWCAVVTSCCVLAGFVLSHFSGGTAAGFFTAAVNWTIAFKFESYLRLLRAIERLSLPPKS